MTRTGVDEQGISHFSTSRRKDVSAHIHFSLDFISADLRRVGRARTIGLHPGRRLLLKQVRSDLRDGCDAAQLHRAFELVTQDIERACRAGFAIGTYAI